MSKNNVTRVLAVSAGFPTPRFPERYVFVKNILLEMARQGASVDVIAPFSWVSAIKTMLNASQNIDYFPLNVKFPTITTMPMSFFKGLRQSIMAFNEAAMSRAIERSLPTDAHYDFCYAHFLPAGRAVLEPAARRGIPVFVNLGESSLWSYDELYGRDAWVRGLSLFSGIITVSKRNHRYLLERDPHLVKKLRYIPNGVDTKRFLPMDKQMCRSKLGLPFDDKIAIFCGHFIERKGPLRVLDAIRRLGIKGIFLGKGLDKPEGPEVLFSGSVVNNDMPLWLNAADVFVLPSLSEGMSNAILEALACGLPLVVSDLDFNHEFLNQECTKFVDPLDPVDIAGGIERCLEPGLSESMRSASVGHAQKYNIERRITLIKEFVMEMVTSR